MTISGRAKLAGVIGDPVAQSLSPRLHAHWLDAHAVDGAYVPLAVARPHFALAVAGLRAAGFRGLNVTVPHKEAAFALAAEFDAAARATGAVNLLVFHDDRIEGRNTDAAGLHRSLAERLGTEAVQGKPVVLLGAGGAARGAVLALAQLGASEIRILARNPARAAALAADLKDAAKSAIPRGLDWTDWPEAAKDAALLVNTTSAGMRGKPALDLPLDPLPPGAGVCDIVYNPLETPLLREARARGHNVIDGLGMLMHQAVPSFEAFYDVTPAVTPALRQELEEALRGGT
jgi:shikimate dehydrogenase